MIWGAQMFEPTFDLWCWAQAKLEEGKLLAGGPPWVLKFDSGGLSRSKKMELVHDPHKRITHIKKYSEIVLYCQFKFNKSIVKTKCVFEAPTFYSLFINFFFSSLLKWLFISTEKKLRNTAIHDLPKIIQFLWRYYQ